MREKLNPSKRNHSCWPGTLSYFPYSVTQWCFSVPGRKTNSKVLFGCSLGWVGVCVCTNALSDLEKFLNKKANHRTATSRML